MVADARAEELELHLGGAIRNGVTRKEIGEILLHSAIYCGYPAALGGFRTAREYFAKHGRKTAGKKRKGRGCAPLYRSRRRSRHRRPTPPRRRAPIPPRPSASSSPSPPAPAPT